MSKSSFEDITEAWRGLLPKDVRKALLRLVKEHKAAAGGPSAVKALGGKTRADIAAVLRNFENYPAAFEAAKAEGYDLEGAIIVVHENEFVDGQGVTTKQRRMEERAKRPINKRAKRGVSDERRPQLITSPGRPRKAADAPPPIWQQVQMAYAELRGQKIRRAECLRRLKERFDVDEGMIENAIRRAKPKTAQLNKF